MFSILSFRRKKPAKSSVVSKRQWGTEKDVQPLSIIHEKPSTKKLTLNRIAIVTTVLFWALYILSTIIREFIDGPKTFQFTMEAYSYALVVTFLTFSALMYLIARQGALQRFARHVRVPRAKLEKFFSQNQPSITVLVPSYNEEPSVIRKTLLSAALQEYPNIRIVLLIDDSPSPIDKDKQAKLTLTRKIGSEITKLLSKPYAKVNSSYLKFAKTSAKKKAISGKQILVLRDLYTWSAKWLRTQSNKEVREDHVDDFFAEQVLVKLADDLDLVAKALAKVVQDKANLPQERVSDLYQRLVWIFNCNLDYFERKKYISLSHEANKAMNLNSYIGLMGGKFKIQDTPDGQVLDPTQRKSDADLLIPDSDYLLTLDADSVLLREYCLRIIYLLERPGNSRLAVAQTPYSSFRNASTRIERIAGATTDIQHILHQGKTHFGATFWVGANAIIRKKALEDIVVKEWSGDFEIKRYIQDRTVIEDTESSVDLGVYGWKLYNYPERLSYSATPPDFGSLIIQRRRWADGGLLILPKLWTQLRHKKNRSELISGTETLLRINYMASIAWASFGLIFLLAYPYDGRLLSPLVLLAALPYFLTMAADLKYCGYKYSDLLQIYGFNLVLLPVNLAGVLKSIEQAFTGKKIPFARTPKVKNRTSVPLIYSLLPILIVIFSLLTLSRNIQSGEWGNAIFAGFNAVLASWAILTFLGFWNVITDLWIGMIGLLYVDDKSGISSTVQPTKSSIDWQAILYHGEERGRVPHASMQKIPAKQISQG